MVAPEPDPLARAVVERIGSRLPESQTGSKRRITGAMVDALAPEFWALGHQLGAVQRDIAGVNARVDRLAGQVQALQRDAAEAKRDVAEILRWLPDTEA